MAKTKTLRQLIRTRVLSVCNNVYYELADKDARYPHIVFDFNAITTDDGQRDDIIVTFDVWDKSTSAVDIENMCDDIEALFNAENLPQETILPTFYLISRIPVQDEDVQIRHRVLKILCQNYER